MNHDARMIERDENWSDALVDRLVDGELSPEEQRTLLEQLDADPQNWRRVGLAFLEAQALRRSCRDWIAPTMSAAVPVTTTAAPSWTALRLATSAVALLLAFALGGMTGRSWPSSSAIVVKAPVAEQVDPPKTEQTIPPVSAVPVAFRYGDGTTTEPVSTPVVEPSSPEAQAWMQASQGVPERVRELLLRNGQKLQERQEWVEIELADGRRGYLPVQEWTVAPISVADYR